MCTEFLVIRATLRRRSYLLEDGQCFEIQPRWTVLCTLRHVTGTELQIPVKLVLVFCRHLGHARDERSWFSSCSRWPTQRSWAHHQQPCHQQLWLAQLPCVWPARMTVICLRPATALQLLHDLATAAAAGLLLQPRVTTGTVPYSCTINSTVLYSSSYYSTVLHVLYFEIIQFTAWLYRTRYSYLYSSYIIINSTVLLIV